MKITKQRLEEIIKEELHSSVTELEQIGDKEGSGVEDSTPRDVDAAITYVVQKINQTGELQPFLLKLASEIENGMPAISDQIKKEALKSFVQSISKIQVSTGALLGKD